jgi:DNA-binding CsgD family transcriptional regulator
MEGAGQFRSPSHPNCGAIMTAISLQPWQTHPRDYPAVPAFLEMPFTPSTPLPALWSALSTGTLSVISSAHTSEIASLELERSGQPKAPLRCGGAIRAFETVLLGEQQKVVAFERGVALATMAAILKQVAARMGCDCRFSRLPLAIPLLVHAIRRPGSLTIHVDGDMLRGNHARAFLSIRRCDALLAPELSSGEYEVVSHLLEGKSYLEMATSRRSCVRTVANQLSSAFKKLGLSGRFALLRLAVERSHRQSLGARPAQLNSVAPGVARQNDYSQRLDYAGQP